MPVAKLHFTGIVLFTAARKRALLLDARKGKASSNPSHPIPAHYSYIRFPMEDFDAANSDVVPTTVAGIDLLDGNAKEFGFVLLNDEEVKLVGSLTTTPLTIDETAPHDPSQGPQNDLEKRLYRWVSNPKHFASADIQVKSDYSVDDPPNVNAYIDVANGKMYPFFGTRPPTIWEFKAPGNGGAGLSAQALAQVIIKEVEYGTGGLAFHFRKYGTTYDANQKGLRFLGGRELTIVIGNSPHDGIMLKHKANPHNPDFHYELYYDYLTPQPQVSRIPHLFGVDSNNHGGHAFALSHRHLPDLGGDNCPPCDPGQP